LGGTGREWIQFSPQAVRSEFEVVHFPEEVRFLLLTEQRHLVQTCQIEVCAVRRSPRPASMSRSERPKDLSFRPGFIERAVVEVADFRPRQSLGPQTQPQPVLRTNVLDRGFPGGVFSRRPCTDGWR